MTHNTHPDTERGAVLLTTLLIMTLMATLAVLMIDDIRFAVKRAVNVGAYAQVDWYMDGTEAFAQTYLTQTLQNLSPEQLNTALLSGQKTVLPIEGGAIALSIRDGSQCLSLGSMDDGDSQRQMRALFRALGVSAREANQMTAKVVDWQDSDQSSQPDGAEDYAYLIAKPPYRTSDTRFYAVDELRAVDGMSENLFQKMRPYVCARPVDASSRVNINTLTPNFAPLLASVLGEEDARGRGVELAARLINERPPAGYLGVTELKDSDALKDAATQFINFDRLVFQPEHILIQAEITYQGVRRVAAFEYRLGQTPLVQTFRGFGETALRPALQEPDD